MIQFIGAKNSFIDYISGTVNISASFLDKTEPEKVDEVLRLIKKEFYPEPFNEDLINEIELKVNSVSDIVTTQNVSIAKSNETIELLTKQILKSEISEENYQEIISIYPDWQSEKDYKVGDVVKHELKAWETIQAHTSQLGWEPKKVPALFKEITPKVVVNQDGSEVEIVPEFVQPTGGHDAYKKGDKVSFEGAIYISKIDANAYSPSDYAVGWEKQA